MERHRDMYKINSSAISPKQHNEINRERQRKARALQRNEDFNKNRIISISPTPQKPKMAPGQIPLTSTPHAFLKKASASESDSKDTGTVPVPEPVRITSNKENTQPNKINVAANAKKNENTTRKEAYLKRFLEWKNTKKQEEITKTMTKRNAVWKSGFSADAPCSSVTTAAKSQLKATAPGITKSNKPITVPSEPPKRDSFYLPVSTPEKKKPIDKGMNHAMMRKALQTYSLKNTGLNFNRNEKAALVLKDPPKPFKKTKTATAVVAGKEHTKTGAVVASSNTKPTVTTKKPLKTAATVFAGNTKVAQITNLKSTAKEPTKTVAAVVAGNTKVNTAKDPINMKVNTAKDPINTKVHTAKDPIKPSVVAANTKVIRKFKEPSKPATSVVAGFHKPGVSNGERRPNIVKPIRTTTTTSGATGKAGVALQQKREDVKKTTKLGTSMKAAKKPVTGISAALKKTNPVVATERVFKTLIDVDPLPFIETPHDPNHINPFEHFVTSTKMKVDEPFEECAISPVTVPNATSFRPKRNLSTDSSAKRALLQQPLVKQQSPIQQRKFNFVRYSEVNTTTDITQNPLDDIDVNKGMESSENEADEVVDKTVVSRDVAYQTPEKTDAERPANYLSPFVTVSRGKVSARSERERRNSMYLSNDCDNTVTNAKENNESISETTLVHTTPIAVRRTLESVRYFRQQLRDETTRLRDICQQWEKYKTEHLALLQEANCDDKIDAAIGQTLLLTSNKFEQFNGLIKRCEAGVTNVGNAVDDGSEDTKLVQAIDLEGFWAMLGLQIENVERRFEDIERWKSNNWIDPDAPKVNTKNAGVKKGKIKKAATSNKAKPSKGLLEFMRKKQADLLKKNAAKELNNNSNSSQTEGGTPTTIRRRSIIVPNRKQFSPAATILSIPNSKRRSPHNSSRRETLATSDTGKDLRKVALLGAAAMETPLKQQTDSPKGRKSILKTPGTAKNSRKSVAFSDKKRVRRFNFMIDETTNSDEEKVRDEIEDYEEDDVKSIDSNQITEMSNNNDNNSDVLNVSTQRSYGLRTRSVKLRPSGEIVIPTRKH